MKAVVHESGVSRWIFFGSGVLAAVAFARGLSAPARVAAARLATGRVSARSWLVLFVLYAITVGSAMGAARLLLT
jgi:hypothetical protein